MERNVTTLETSKRLKAAGFPQGTYFKYVDGELWDTTAQSDFETPATGSREEWVAAPTAQEVADQLGFGATVNTVKGGWSAGSLNAAPLWPRCKDATMAEALALLWLKLNESTKEQGE